MTMDLIVLGIFLLTLIVCIARGFLLTLISFIRGIASWIIAWIFADDFANFLINDTKFGTKVAAKINSILQGKIDSSNILDMLPKALVDNGSINPSGLIQNGSVKIAQILITVFAFFVIAITLTILLGVAVKILKKRNKKSIAGKFDRTLGIILGTVLGLIYVYAFLALLIPVVGIILPARADVIMGWFEGSVISKAMYDNNILLMLLKTYL